jgi:hypothetical protein
VLVIEYEVLNGARNHRTVRPARSILTWSGFWRLDASGRRFSVFRSIASNSEDDRCHFS